MWLDKAATWELAEQLGGVPLVSLIRVETHSCYAGDRTTTHDWGAGCGTCPACELRRTGYQRYLERGAERGAKPDARRGENRGSKRNSQRAVASGQD